MAYAKAKAFWNVTKTKSVVLAKLKEFSIDEAAGGFPGWIVRGWYNKENCFIFGNFTTRKEAEDYLEEVHKCL